MTLEEMEVLETTLSQFESIRATQVLPICVTEESKDTHSSSSKR